MKVIETEIENFLALKSAKVSLDERGLLLVQGENRDDESADSNGAGKSSLGDAVFWCLYGETARGISGDDVVNDTAKKGAWVRVIVQDDGDRYWIDRYRKHKTHKNSLRVTTVDGAGNEIDLSKGTDKETQEVVNGILGCSLDVFKAAVYSGQEQMPDLPGMTDKHLKVLVEEAAGIDLLEKAYTIARQEMGSVAAQEATYSTTATNAVAQVVSRRAALDGAVAHRDEWEAGRAERAERHRIAARAKVQQAVKFKGEVDAVDQDALKARAAAINASLSAYKLTEDELRRLGNVSGAANAALSRVQAQYDALVSTAKQLNVELTNVEAKVGSPCGECGKPYCEHDIEGARVIWKARVVTAATTAHAKKAEIATAATDLAAAVAAVDAHRATMVDVSALSAELRQVTGTINGVGLVLRQIDEEKAAAERELALVKQAETEPNPYTVTVEAAEADLKKAVETRIKADEGLEAKRAELAVAADAVKVFGPAGVRAQILDTVTPYLNTRTGHYLGALSDGNIEAVWSTLTKTAKGELREKFSIAVTNGKGGKSFAAQSGGEKRKVRIAAALALQDLVASRASKPISLWIADEIDDALDPAGLERLMGVLEERARERGTVMVISHNSLTDWIREGIMVVKEGGVSTVQDSI